MSVPTVATFKAFFSRGFTYGTTPPAISDSDITKAIAEAESVFNAGIYPDDAAATMAELYLTAHYLVSDIDAADNGHVPRFNQVSRGADGLSESVDIPEWMKSGDFAFYATTYYGQKWLMLTKPYLGGAVYTVGGATLP